jgi:hypothetical protein
MKKPERRPPKSTPSGDRAVVTLRLDKRTLARVDEAAKREGIDREKWFQIAITKGLER